MLFRSFFAARTERRTHPSSACGVAVEACDPRVGKEASKEGPNESPDPMEREAIDRIVEFEADLERSGVVARDGTDEAKSEGGGGSDILKRR